MAFGRLLTLTFLIQAFATSAYAGVRMYTGEMIVHMRGSDAAGNFIGVPFGKHCNTRPYTPAHTAMFTYPPYTYTLNIPAFGGQVPVIDTNMDGKADVAAGCAPASLQPGLPLTGGGSLSTTGATTTARTPGNPRAFSLPKSDIARTTTGGSFLATTFLPLPLGDAPFEFEIEHANLKNGLGAFADGGGPGAFTVSPGTAKQTARVHVKAGANRFGGTMRLLGQYYTVRGLETATTSVGATPWNLQYMGAGANTAKGVVTAGLQYTTMITRSYHYYGKFGRSARTATISVFPWTTGTAEVSASGGPQSTMLQRAGYDNRTPGGRGTIQMVSPALTHWRNTYGEYFTGSIASLKLKFVPEPDAWLMLASGIGALAALRRVGRSRGRA